MPSTLKFFFLPAISFSGDICIITFENVCSTRIVRSYSEVKSLINNFVINIMGWNRTGCFENVSGVILVELSFKFVMANLQNPRNLNISDNSLRID